MKTTMTRLALLSTLTFLLPGYSGIPAITGHRDTSFGKKGLVVQTTGGAGTYNSEGWAVATDARGRIFVVGSTTSTTPSIDLAVWCFKPDGKPDLSFGGGDGVVTQPSPAGNVGAQGYAAAVDHAGRLVVTGYGANANSDSDMVIWRFTPNGALDLSFGGTGFVISNNAAGGNYSDQGRAVAIDAQGRIVVAGDSANPLFTTSMVLWRYNSNGTPDTTFGGTGIVVAAGAATSNGLGMTLDGQGKIVVCGTAVLVYGGLNDMALWRFNADGTPDTTLAGTGFVMHNNAGGGDYLDLGNSVQIDSHGRIVVGGNSAGPNFGYDLVVWRFLANGSLDTSFNGKGFATRSDLGGLVNGDDWGTAVGIDHSGNIVLAGFSATTNSETADLVLAGFTSAGKKNNAFGTGGAVVEGNIAGGNGDDFARGMLIDCDGRALVVGTSISTNGTSAMVLLRYK